MAFTLVRGGVVAEWSTSKLVLGLVLVLDAVTTIGAGKGTIVACGAVVWECVLVATEGGACKSVGDVEEWLTV